jgi:serine/threonine-protein kinase
LGVTAVVLLTGKTPELLQDRYSLEWQWSNYTNVSRGLAQVLDKLLAYKPKERFQSAQDVLAALGLATSAGVTLVEDPVNVLHHVDYIPHQNLKKTAPEIQQRHSINSAFLEFCRQELASLIGSIANFLIQDLLRQNPEISAQTLIETLEAKIPNPQQAIAFRHRLL